MDHTKRHLAGLTQGSWLYPLKGIWYFLVHPFLYPLFRARLIPALLLSIFVTANFFIWTYIPQVLALLIYQGPSAWLNATTLVLGESAAVTAIFFEAFFVDESQVDIFDAVLINEGHSDLVSQGRELRPNVSEAGQPNGRVGEDDANIARPTHDVNPAQRLGKPIKPATYSPFSFRQTAEFVLFLPLNLIPFAGTPLFLVATGYRAGPLHHWRYFRLRKFTKSERKTFIKRRQLKYTWFGMISLMLQLIPVLAMAFLCTNAVGSALWAAKLEEQRKNGERHQVSNGDDGEPYADDPV